MRKHIIGTCLTLAPLVVGGGAAAEESPHQFSANIAPASDYLYRGISQTNENPAVQGGMDYAHGPTGLYVGARASNVDFAESLEIDVYGGISGEFGDGLGWDAGGVCYIYPGSDAEPEESFVEAYARASYAFPGRLEPTVGAGVAYSPDFFGEDGDGVYLPGALDLSLPQGFGLSFYLGRQDVSGDQTPPSGFNYMHYSIGLSKSLGPLALGASWNGADDDCSGDICETAVFSISTGF